MPPPALPSSCIWRVSRLCGTTADLHAWYYVSANGSYARKPFRPTFHSTRSSRPSWSRLRWAQSRSIPIRSMCRPNAVGEPAIDGAWACGSSSASCGRLPCRLPSEAQKRAAERAVEVSDPSAFQQQESRKQRIDGSWGHRDFSLGLLFLPPPPPPLPQSHGQDGEEECEIRVGEAHDCEASAGEQPAKPGTAIPP